MKTKIVYPKGFPCARRLILILLTITLACLILEVFAGQPENNQLRSYARQVFLPGGEGLPVLNPCILPAYAENIFACSDVEEAVYMEQAGFQLEAWMCCPWKCHSAFSAISGEAEEQQTQGRLEAWMMDFSLEEKDPEPELESWMLDPAALYRR